MQSKSWLSLDRQVRKAVTGLREAELCSVGFDGSEWVEAKTLSTQPLALEKGKNKERSWWQGGKGPLLPLKGLCV